MWLFLCEEVPTCRWYAYCDPPYPATLDYFQWHSRGRYHLQTICRYCQNHNQRVLRRLRKAHGPAPEFCQSCGTSSLRLQLDHCHETDAFRAWVCQPCNEGAAPLHEGVHGNTPEGSAQEYAVPTQARSYATLDTTLKSISKRRAKLVVS